MRINVFKDARMCFNVILVLCHGFLGYARKCFNIDDTSQLMLFDTRACFLMLFDTRICLLGFLDTRACVLMLLNTHTCVLMLFLCCAVYF